PGVAADPRRQEAGGTVGHANVHAGGVRRGGHGTVTGAGVGSEVRGLNDEPRAGAGLEDGPVDPPSAAEHRGQPITREAINPLGEVAVAVNPPHPPVAAGAAGAVAAGVLLGEHDRVRLAVTETARETGDAVPVRARVGVDRSAEDLEVAGVGG